MLNMGKELITITLDTQATMTTTTAKITYYTYKHTHTETHTGDTYDDNDIGYTSHHALELTHSSHTTHTSPHTHTLRLTLVILMMATSLDTLVSMLYYYRIDYILYMHTYTHRDSHW